MARLSAGRVSIRLRGDFTSISYHASKCKHCRKIESTLSVMDMRAPRKRLVTQAVVHLYAEQPADFLKRCAWTKEVRRGLPCTFPACFTKVCLGASYFSVTFTVEPKKSTFRSISLHHQCGIPSSSTTPRSRRLTLPRLR